MHGISSLSYPQRCQVLWSIQGSPWDIDSLWFSKGREPKNVPTEESYASAERNMLYLPEGKMVIWCKTWSEYWDVLDMHLWLTGRLGFTSSSGEEFPKTGLGTSFLLARARSKRLLTSLSISSSVGIRGTFSVMLSFTKNYVFIILFLRSVTRRLSRLFSCLVL